LSFKSKPQKVTSTSTGLHLQFAQTTYLINRWPDFKVVARRARATEWKPVNALIRNAVFEVLHRLRISKCPAQRLTSYDLLRDMPLWMHARLLPLQEYYWQGVHWLTQIPELGCLLESSSALFAIVIQHLEVGAIFDDDELRMKLQGRQRELLGW